MGVYYFIVSHVLRIHVGDIRVTTLLLYPVERNLACYRLIRALATAATWIFLATNLRTFQSNKTGGRNTLWFLGVPDGTSTIQTLYVPIAIFEQKKKWKFLPWNFSWCDGELRWNYAPRVFRSLGGPVFHWHHTAANGGYSWDFLFKVQGNRAIY